MAYSQCSGDGPRAARVQENILVTRDLLSEAVRNLDGLPPAVTPHQGADGSAGNHQTGEGLET